MRRSATNFTLDLITLLVMLGMVVTGLLIRYVLPPGRSGGHGGDALHLFGMNRHEWGSVHFWMAAALGLLIAVHLALHWSWVCAMVSCMLHHKEENIARMSTFARNLYGVAFLLGVAVFLYGVLWIASLNVQEVPGPRRQLVVDQIGVNGSMTLEEIQTRTGVPVEFVLQELDLPSHVAADERLGPLRREFDFRMSAVRDVIRKYQAEHDIIKESEVH